MWTQKHQVESERKNTVNSHAHKLKDQNDITMINRKASGTITNMNLPTSTSVSFRESFCIYHGSFWDKNFYRFNAILLAPFNQALLAETMTVTLTVTWLLHHKFTAHTTYDSYHFPTSYVKVEFHLIAYKPVIAYKQ